MFISQVWYVWFTTNWLQILFLLTLVLLLVSSCVTFQVRTLSNYAVFFGKKINLVGNGGGYRLSRKTMPNSF